MAAARCFQIGEEIGVHDHAVLDHLGQAAPQLARGQRLERVDVDPHGPRLVKGADDVLGTGVVDADLAADRAVDLGQQGGGHHDQRQPARVGRRGKAGQVADHASAQGQHHGVPIGTELDQSIVEQGGRIEALGRLAGRQHGGRAGDPHVLELGLACRETRQPRHVAIGHDQGVPRGPAGPRRLERRPGETAEPARSASHANRIRACSQRDGNHGLRLIGWGWHALCLLQRMAGVQSADRVPDQV